MTSTHTSLPLRTTPDSRSMSSSPEQPTAGRGFNFAAVAHFAGQSWKWLKWPVAIGILCWMYWRHEAAISAILETPKIWGYAVLAFLLIAGSTLLTFARWYLLVRGQEFPFR